MRMVDGFGKNRGEGEESPAAADEWEEITQTVSELVVDLLDGLQLCSDEGNLEDTGNGGAAGSSLSSLESSSNGDETGFSSEEEP